MAEQGAHNSLVTGSNPVRSTPRAETAYDMWAFVVEASHVQSNESSLFVLLPSSLTWLSCIAVEASCLIEIAI